MTLQTMDWLAVGRMALILIHVLAVAAACAGIVFGDYAIFARRQYVDGKLLGKAAQAVIAALLVLWFTGLGVIWIDTHFDWAILATMPKLLAKLTIVTLLSINGIALHFWGFSRLCTACSEPLQAAKLPAALGAVSVVTWLYAAFVGLAKPLAPVLGYSGFVGLYCIVLGGAVIFALVWMSPQLARRMPLEASARGNTGTATEHDQGHDDQFPQRGQGLASAFA